MNTEKFENSFIFWITVYSEAIKAKVIDPIDLYKLVNFLFNNEEAKQIIIKNQIDFELIDSFSILDRSKVLKLAEIAINAMESEFEAVDKNVYKLNNEGPYRWLIHIFNILNKEKIEDEELIKKVINQAVMIIKLFHESAKYFPAYKDNIFVSPLIYNAIRLLIAIGKLAIDFPISQNLLINSLWSFCKDCEFTLREKIELCHFFHIYFKDCPSVINCSIYWDILSDGLTVEDSMIRKYSITLVKDNLQRFLGQYQGSDKIIISDLWVTLFDIYDISTDAALERM